LTDDVDFYAKINPESEPSMNFGRSSIWKLMSIMN
jgi:hypothetical protein